MKDQELNIAIGRRLRATRVARGLKQSDLAKHIDVAFQQIQKYENGSNRLSVAVLLRLCAFMEIDPGAFLKEIDHPVDLEAPEDVEVVAETLRRITNRTVRVNLFALIRSLEDEQT